MRNFIIALNAYIFNATFSRGWCISSSIYSELLNESKSTFFSEFASLIKIINDTETDFFIHSRPEWSSTFLHIRPFLESVGSSCPHKALMSKKKGLHARTPQIYYFPLKIGEEQKKKICTRPAVCPALVLKIFWFFKISLLAAHL